MPEHGPEYTDNRTTVLEMEWTSEPSTVTVTPSSALASQSWDESTGKLTLSLSHPSGSVTVNVAE
jgi:hypothetical protein